jgi:hypothetical protein
MAVVGDDHAAGIDVYGRQSEVLEGESHDITRQALSVTRNGVDGTRGEFAEHRDSLYELGHFLEMVIERAIELGAVLEWNHLASFAGVEVAEVVELADVVFAFTGYGGLGYGEEFVGGLAHRGYHYDGVLGGAGFDDGRYAFYCLGGFYGGASEFHDDHVKTRLG